jgi:hypothetical protein
MPAKSVLDNVHSLGSSAADDIRRNVVAPVDAPLNEVAHDKARLPDFGGRLRWWFGASTTLLDEIGYDAVVSGDADRRRIDISGEIAVPVIKTPTVSRDRRYVDYVVSLIFGLQRIKDNCP